MQTSIIIVDSFYADPAAVRKYALGQRYYFPYQPDEDVASGRVKFSWMTSWFKPAEECPFKSSAELIQKLEHAIGETIDRDHWRLPFPITPEGKAAPSCAEVRRKSCLWNTSFHFKPNTGQKLGEGVHNHVTDSWNSVGENGWAGLLYLSPGAPLRGGLKTWRNRDPLKIYDWMTPKDNWELIDDLGNVFNRLLLCRGKTPHSGAVGWGNNLENGRLYQTFFFKTRVPRDAAGVDVGLQDQSVLCEER